MTEVISADLGELQGAAFQLALHQHHKLQDPEPGGVKRVFKQEWLFQRH